MIQIPEPRRQEEIEENCGKSSDNYLSNPSRHCSARRHRHRLYVGERDTKDGEERAMVRTGVFRGFLLAILGCLDTLFSGEAVNICPLKPAAHT